jgi:hypothetical protein
MSKPRAENWMRAKPSQTIKTSEKVPKRWRANEFERTATAHNNIQNRGHWMGNQQ